MNITDQQFEDLAKRWPDLFQKALISSLDVGPGWRGLIDTLCSQISSKLEAAKRQLKYSKEDTTGRYADKIPTLEAEVEKHLSELPIIRQVKEKFGGLRFYVDADKADIPAVYNYIRFAEEMSMCMCEQCGAPGEARSDGWTKVLCDRHHRERMDEQIAAYGITQYRFRSASKSSDDL